ncbi:hypothetical protein ACFW9O_34005 [Streptomyces sp. NPDC059499]|uniref:hypothetical protein n=1 Tax=Streptomyces sp. NPDC059499 TaxID=3346852 RepID=UPI0036784F13
MDHLKTLERDISGGALANRSIEELARRMYEAIAPVVDQTEQGKPNLGIGCRALEPPVRNAPDLVLSDGPRNC